MASKQHAARNAAAKRAGFRNYYHYSQAIKERKVASLLKKAGVRKGRSRYELAALAANVKTLPGEKGSTERTKKAGILSDAIRRAGKNPAKFWGDLKSPKRPKK